MEAKRKRAVVLINKAAGVGKAASNTIQIAEELAMNGYEPVIYPIIPGTELVAEKILDMPEDEPELVICCGGDGTLNHVTQAVMSMESRPRLAYIPTGSTNDFAKSIGIPAELSQALKVAVKGRPFRCDIGNMNGRYFNYVAAFGAFTAVSYATSQEMKNVMGYAAYIINAIAELPQSIHYKCHLKIELDDETIEDDYVFGAICNSLSIGGIKVFDERIRFNDGKLELLLIRSPKTTAEMQGILNSLWEGSLKHPNILVRQISHMKAKAGNETSWTIDGEFGGSYDEVDINVIKDAIDIMTEEY